MLDIIIIVSTVLNNIISYYKTIDTIVQFEGSGLLVKQSESSRTTYSTKQFYIPDNLNHQQRRFRYLKHSKFIFTSGRRRSNLNCHIEIVILFVKRRQNLHSMCDFLLFFFRV
jgi:hypothetical protein